MPILQNVASLDTGMMTAFIRPTAGGTRATASSRCANTRDFVVVKY